MMVCPTINICCSMMKRGSSSIKLSMEASMTASMRSKYAGCFICKMSRVCALAARIWSNTAACTCNMYL